MSDVLVDRGVTAADDLLVDVSARLGLLQAVRGVVEANIPDGFVVGPRHYAGMETWIVDPARAPRTYDGRPPAICAVGERKSYVSLFLMGLYYDPTMNHWLEAEWAASGCPLRRGRASVQLRDVDDVPFDVVAAAVARLSVDDVVGFFDRFWAARADRRRP